MAMMLEERIDELKAIIAGNDGRNAADFRFARDGILAEGQINSEMMVLGDLDFDLLHESRERGTVLPLRDSRSTAEVPAELEEVRV